jgi:hypothetical protein
MNYRTIIAVVQELKPGTGLSFGDASSGPEVFGELDYTGPGGNFQIGGGWLNVYDGESAVFAAQDAFTLSGPRLLVLDPDGSYRVYAPEAAVYEYARQLDLVSELEHRLERGV